MQTYWVYILLCADMSYYTGITSNLEKRINDHNYGRYKGYTSKRLPVILVYSQGFKNVDEAIKIEKIIKKWNRNKKEALISGELSLLHGLSECKNITHYKNKK